MLLWKLFTRQDAAQVIGKISDNKPGKGCKGLDIGAEVHLPTG